MDRQGYSMLVFKFAGAQANLLITYLDNHKANKQKWNEPFCTVPRIAKIEDNPHFDYPLISYVWFMNFKYKNKVATLILRRAQFCAFLS